MGWSHKRYIPLLLLIAVTALQAGKKREEGGDNNQVIILNTHTHRVARSSVKLHPKVVKASLSEDFEAGVIPSEWTVIDRDGDGHQWTAYNSSSYAHSGNYSAAVQYNPSGNDDWLITPALIPQTGDSFTFWARSHSSTYLEDFEVLVSTTTPEPDSFVRIDSVGGVPDSYTYYAYDLSSYAGETIYVAIRCVSVDEFYLHVDDVSGPTVYIVDTIAPTIGILQSPRPHFYTGIDDQIVAIIRDVSGIQTASLSYSTDLGVTWNPVPFTEVGTDTFVGNIPAQPRGSKVIWKVFAEDSAGNADSVMSYYTIMPSGKKLIVYTSTSELLPLYRALVHNDIDTLPDYMQKGELLTYADSLPYWTAILYGETGRLGSDTLDAIKNFLEAGTDTSRKVLVIFGDDIGYYASAYNYLDKLHQILRVDYIKDDMSSATDTDTIIGVTGDPISDGMPPFVIYSPFPDMVKPWTPWEGVDLPWAFIVDENGDSVNTPAGIVYNGLKYQVFYMPYEVSEIASQEYVDTLIKRIYNFVTANVTPPMPDWCGIQWPQADTVIKGIDSVSHMIYGQVYKAGVTDVGVQDSSNFIVELGVGPEGTMPNDSSWSWVRAVFNTAHGNDGNNYEYMAQINIDTLPGGVYDYAFRFSYNGGPWVYADWGSSGGSSDGYQPENAGKLYVIPFVTVYDVQDTSDVTFAGDTSNYFGQMVVVSGVVTGVYSRGFFLEDQAGGAWSGVWIYKNGADTIVQRGDSVIIKGTVSEHYGLTEIIPDTIMIVASGVALPAPVSITTGAANNEAYEGVLLRVVSARCTNPDLGYGEWQIDDGTGPLRVDDMGYAFTPDTDSLYNVTAPLYYSYGNYKLEPRDSLDIERFSYPEIVINELYYDSPGTDSGVFIELKGEPGQSLENVHIFGINGNGGVIYADIDLTGWTIGPSGYFVIAKDSSVANADTVAGASADYQNGPDNVVLVYITPADTTVLDALGYGNFTATDTFVGEGSPAPDAPEGLSLQRIPDGNDTDDNSADFRALMPTPGVMNGEAVVFEDNFDDDTLRWTGNWAKTGSTYHSPDSSFTDSPSGNYPNNATLVGEINQDIDLTSYYGARLKFWTKYALEEGWDSVHLQISTDGGATWHDVKAYTGTVSDWTQEIIDLGAYAGKVIRVRFVLISDAAVNEDGMYIDDVELTGSMIDDGAPAIHHTPPAISQDIIGDFIAVATIIDPSPLAIDSLYYKADTMADFTAIAPDSVVDTLSYFTIPAQRIGARVDYYFVAADTAMNRAQTDVYTYYQGIKFIYDDGDPQYYMPIDSTTNIAVAVTGRPDTGIAISAMMVLHYYSPSQGVTGGNYRVHVYDRSFNDIITPFIAREDTDQGNVFWNVIDLTQHNGGEPIYLTYNDTVYLGIEGMDNGADTVALMLDSPSSGYYHTYMQDTLGNWNLVNADIFIRAIGDYVSSAKENMTAPLKFTALVPMPNPFHGHTVIKFALPEKQNVTLDIYDVNGRRVTRLLNGKLNAGWHTVTWNGTDARGRRVKSGVYFYRLTAGKYRKTVKMLLVR